ncbi:hypothetical protein ACWOFR_07800 [Carnobacterium gallinarum]
MSELASENYFKLLSDWFENGNQILDLYTGIGEDISSKLHWLDVPQNTKQFLVICEDTDVPFPIPSLCLMVMAYIS